MHVSSVRFPCNAHPGYGGGVERPCGQRNTIVRCQPRQAQTPDARRQTRRVFRLTRIAYPLNEMEDAPGLREELVGGMDVCLILSQRIERNKPRRDSRPARGLGGTSSAISKTIEFPAISKPQARLFIHPYIHPSPRSHHHPEIMSRIRPSARPPIRPLCHLPFLYQDPPHLRARSPRHPRPGFPLWVGGWVGGAAIPNEYTKSMRCRWARGP